MTYAAALRKAVAEANRTSGKAWLIFTPKGRQYRVTVSKRLRKGESVYCIVWPTKAVTPSVMKGEFST